MTVGMERDFDPAENFPSVVMDALQRMVSALDPFAAPVRIKPGASNTLQVPAGTADDAQGLIITGHWRWNESAAEVAGSGSAGLRDVWAVTGDSVYTSGSPGETDSTDRSFTLRVTAADAGAPSGGGIVYTRRIARALWDGAQFVAVAPMIGGAPTTPTRLSAVGSVATSESTASGTPVDLTTPGPQVTVDVPDAALVEIFAAVAVTGEVFGTITGKVNLLEDGSDIGGVLSLAPASTATVHTSPASSSGTVIRTLAAPVVFPVAAGTHTYKLRYSAAGGTATFANRSLWARVRSA